MLNSSLKREREEPTTSEDMPAPRETIARFATLNHYTSNNDDRCSLGTAWDEVIAGGSREKDQSGNVLAPISSDMGCFKVNAGQEHQDLHRQQSESEHSKTTIYSATTLGPQIHETIPTIDAHLWLPFISPSEMLNSNVIMTPISSTTPIQSEKISISIGKTQNSSQSTNETSTLSSTMATEPYTNASLPEHFNPQEQPHLCFNPYFGYPHQTGSTTLNNSTQSNKINNQAMKAPDAPFATPISSSHYMSYMTPASISSNPAYFSSKEKNAVAQNASTKKSPHYELLQGKGNSVVFNDGGAKIFSPPLTPAIEKLQFAPNQLPLNPGMNDNLASSSAFTNVIAPLSAQSNDRPTTTSSNQDKNTTANHRSKSANGQVPKVEDQWIIKSFRKIVWEDQGINVYELSIGPHILCRRADTNMINATKLMNLTVSTSFPFTTWAYILTMP